VTDLATLMEQLEALKAARRSGVKTTTFGERSTTARDDRELVAQIAAVEADIAAAQGSPRPTVVLVRSNKGFL
jgi:hypothetical protein